MSWLAMEKKSLRSADRPPANPKIRRLGDKSTNKGESLVRWKGKTQYRRRGHLGVGAGREERKQICKRCLQSPRGRILAQGTGVARKGKGKMCGTRHGTKKKKNLE